MASTAFSRPRFRSPFPSLDAFFGRLRVVADDVRPLPRWALLAVALTALGQFSILASVSIAIVNDASLTLDFGISYQAWSLIARGILNPYDTIEGFPYWQNHFILAAWPLSSLALMFHSALTLKLLQDAALAIAFGAVALWSAQLLLSSVRPDDDRALYRRRVTAFVVLCLVLVITPFPSWANSFDYHYEAVIAMFVTLAAYAAWRKAQWLYLFFIVFALLQMDLAGPYVISLSAIVFLTVPKLRRMAAFTLVLGLVWFQTAHALNASRGSFLSATYGYLAGVNGDDPTFKVTDILKGLIFHPERALRHAWDLRMDFWANTSVPFIASLLFPLSFAVGGVGLLENQISNGICYAVPSFQSTPVYCSLAMGAAWVMRWTTNRLPRWAFYTVAVLIVANAIGWAGFWYPETLASWLRVDPSIAERVKRLAATIPSDEEVIASQGVVGMLSDRQPVYPYPFADYLTFEQYPGPGIVSHGYPSTVPFVSPKVHFVIAPWDGIEFARISEACAFEEFVVTDLGAKIEDIANGYLYATLNTDQMSDAQKSFRYFLDEDDLAAWTQRTDIGILHREGPPQNWYLETPAFRTTGGHLLKQAYWRLPIDAYRARFTLSGSGRNVILEVRDASGDFTIGRRAVTLTAKKQTFDIEFVVDQSHLERLYNGWGPFQMVRQPGPVNDQIELTVYVPPSASARIYRDGITPLSNL